MSTQSVRRSHTLAISRRSAMAITGGMLGGYFLNSGSLYAQQPDFENYTGDQHACLELPVFNSTDSDEVKSRSPTEFAYMIREGRLANAPAAAAQLAVTDFPEAVKSPEARAAFTNSLTLADKTLRFFFMGTEARLVERIIAHAREWTKYIDVKFDIINSAAQADVRVRCSRTLGHSSHIGSDARRVPASGHTMTLGFSDLVDFEKQAKHNQFVVLHEVGHALGLIHEHNRPDAVLPFDPAKTIAYFGQRGLNRDQVKYNIFDRWMKTLIKFSEYDPFSIMHYMFPKEIMKSGQGTVQNYVLSALDIKMAQEMYGTNPNGDPPPPTPGPANVGTILPLTIDGAAVTTTIAQNQAASLSLKVAANQAGKPYTICTEGSTQVVLQLFGPNDGNKAITPEKVPGHGTYDLTNDVIQVALVEGEYIVKAQHVSARGGGAVSVWAKTGERFGNRLLPPNRLLP